MRITRIEYLLVRVMVISYISNSAWLCVIYCKVGGGDLSYYFTNNKSFFSGTVPSHMGHTGHTMEKDPNVYLQGKVILYSTMQHQWFSSLSYFFLYLRDYFVAGIYYISEITWPPCKKTGVCAVLGWIYQCLTQISPCRAAPLFVTYCKTTMLQYDHWGEETRGNASFWLQQTDDIILGWRTSHGAKAVFF